jgi:hypothetical protein
MAEGKLNSQYYEQLLSDFANRFLEWRWFSARDAAIASPLMLRSVPYAVPRRTRRVCPHQLTRRLWLVRLVVLQRVTRAHRVK